MPYGFVVMRFHANTQEEADRLVDDLIDAEADILCPSDDARLQTCGNCNGTLVNPDDDGYDPATDPAWWAPGEPCSTCSDSEHPGQEMPCARHHHAYAVTAPDDKPMEPYLYQARAVLHGIAEALSRSPQEASQMLASAIAEIDEEEQVLLRDAYPEGQSA